MEWSAAPDSEDREGQVPLIRACFRHPLRRSVARMSESVAGVESAARGGAGLGDAGSLSPAGHIDDAGMPTLAGSMIRERYSASSVVPSSGSTVATY